MTNKIVKPEPIKYTIPNGPAAGKIFIIDDPKQIVTERGNRCLDGGIITIEGTRHQVYITIDNKPALKPKVDQWLNDWDVYKAAKDAEFASNVPGYDILKDAQDAAYNEEQRYRNQMSCMMETGHSIGPKPLDKSLRINANQLAELYPRAALYLKAEGYMLSNNSNKYSAGRKAKDIIANGGSLEKANEILENWVPEDAKWH